MTNITVLLSVTVTVIFKLKVESVIIQCYTADYAFLSIRPNYFADYRYTVPIWKNDEYPAPRSGVPLLPPVPEMVLSCDQR